MDEEKRHTKELTKLGRAIREARERRGLSEREVADAVCGVSSDGVRAIEAGKRPRLNYAEIVRLARALGVEPGSLFVRAEGLSAECGAARRNREATG
jgi:transcriptional regulator with XRE-family HTH domain